MYRSTSTAILLIALLDGLWVGCTPQPNNGPVATSTSVGDSSPVTSVAPTVVGASKGDALQDSAVVGATEPPPGGGGGSAGAPYVEPERFTREEFVALVNKNEALRTDIRATNPKLQLIIDGKFDEFEKLLDQEPRLASVRWGYYEDKPDPLNPFSPPPRGGPMALHLAAEHGSLPLVKRLATPEAIRLAESSNAGGIQSPICFAANVEIAQALLNAGAMLKPETDVSGLGSPMPMRGAAERGNLQLCKWLLANGAQVDMETVNGQHWRPIGFACEHGHLDVVKWMHEQGVALRLLPSNSAEERRNEIYNVGSTPLARAAAGGQVDVIKFLLANGAKADLNLQTKTKPTQPYQEAKPIEFSPALCRAAAGGHIEAVRLLLDEGAQTSSVNAPNPLHMAALHGNEEVFKLLLKRGGKITTDKYVTRVEEVAGNDLLCCAVRGGNAAIFRQVVEKWPRAWMTDAVCSDRYAYYQGRGPIAIAVSAGREDLVRHMIARPEAADSPESKVMMNHALATAVETDQTAMLKILREANVPLDQPLQSPSPGRKDVGQSPIERAAMHGNCDVLRFLVEQGMEIDTPDDEGRTALHRACRREFAPVTRNQADRPFRLKLIKCLLELGASPTAKDKSGRSVLHDAALYLEPEEISLLLDHRASPMVHDKDGESPAAMLARLLAGKYKSDAEPRPWNEQWDKPPERIPYSWHERIRCEENLKLLR